MSITRQELDARFDTIRSAVAWLANHPERHARGYYARTVLDDETFPDNPHAHSFCILGRIAVEAKMSSVVPWAQDDHYTEEDIRIASSNQIMRQVQTFLKPLELSADKLMIINDSEDYDRSDALIQIGVEIDKASTTAYRSVP